MQQNRTFFWIIFACMLILSLGQKVITFKKVQCPLRSTKVQWIKCGLEDNSTISVEGASGSFDIKNVIGLSELNLQIMPKHRSFHIGGIRLEICKILEASEHPSLLTFFYNGLRKADNNFPKKCPFRRNTTYVMRHLKFDVNYLPSYVVECDFTFNGKFYGNSEHLFDVRVVGSVCNISNNCTTEAAKRHA